jgi:hypothetical protein
MRIRAVMSIKALILLKKGSYPMWLKKVGVSVQKL